MSVTAHDARGRPRLTVVRGSRAPLVDVAADWRRVAAAVLACTHELSRHLLEQRWVRVDEAMQERRELLGWLKEMPLDADGRRCLLSLGQAADESERAICSMMGSMLGSTSGTARNPQ
jgi:hypothetical protein